MASQPGRAPAMTAEHDLADRIGRAVLDEGLDPEQAEDHLEIVRRASEAEQVARGLLRQSVAAARANGHSWSALGAVLGMSRQAAQQRFGSPVAAQDGGAADETRVLGPVTAFDELPELELAGRQGWRTTGVGMFTHTMQRTPTQWEHRRVVWSRPTSRYLRDGWVVGARSFPWLYLVRDTGLPAERPD